MREITTTIYKRNAAMCSIVYLCRFVRDFILIINRGAIYCQLHNDC